MIYDLIREVHKQCRSQMNQFTKNLTDFSDSFMLTVQIKQYTKANQTL